MWNNKQIFQWTMWKIKKKMSNRGRKLGEKIMGKSRCKNTVKSDSVKAERKDKNALNSPQEKTLIDKITANDKFSINKGMDEIVLSAEQDLKKVKTFWLWVTQINDEKENRRLI